MRVGALPVRPAAGEPFCFLVACSRPFEDVWFWNAWPRFCSWAPTGARAHWRWHSGRAGGTRHQAVLFAGWGCVEGYGLRFLGLVDNHVVCRASRRERLKSVGAADGGDRSTLHPHWRRPTASPSPCSALQHIAPPTPLPSPCSPIPIALLQDSSPAPTNQWRVIGAGNPCQSRATMAAIPRTLSASLLLVTLAHPPPRFPSVRPLPLPLLPTTSA